MQGGKLITVSRKFRKRVNYRRLIITVFSTVGFVAMLFLTLIFSNYLIIPLENHVLHSTIVIIGDVIKVLFSFTIAWILRSLYLNNIDVVISKMELYEMKNIHAILSYEIKRMEAEKERDIVELLDLPKKNKRNIIDCKKD